MVSHPLSAPRARHPSRTILLAGASILAVSAASILTVSAAVAQDTPSGAETIVLDTVVLTATTDASVQAEGYVAGQTQAATKSNTPVAETQQSVSVVTVDQIEDQGATTLGQALSYTAGVVGEPFGADPRFDSPTIRGFEARGSQYVNGLRQIRYMGAPAYETYGLQQVELLRGPSSSLYGAGSPAGIINQVQKRAQDFEITEAGAGLDSNSSKTLFFDINRPVSDQLSWRLTGVARDNQTQIDELTNKRGYLAGALRWRPDDQTTIDVIASHTADSPISPPGVPYALTLTQSGKTLRDLYAGEPGWDDSDREMTNFGVEISRELDNGWTLQQGFRAEKFTWDYTGHYVSGLTDDGTAITRGANAQSEDTFGLSLDTRLAGEVTTGAAIHKLLVGLDIRQYDADTRTDFLRQTPLNWSDPAYGTAPGEAWYIAESDLKLRQIGIYAQDEIELGNWRGSIALRHDRTRQWGEAGNNFTGISDQDQKDSATTGRLGLGYQFATGVMPYVSYSTSFDPEIGVDHDGNLLKPTTGKQWELGVKYQPDAFDGLITASVYDLRQENLTRRVVEDGVPGNRQIGEVKSRGFELEATAALTERWNLRGGYAWNETEQIGGDNDGNEMPNAPQHLANLWLDHDFGNGARVGGGLRHIGQRYGDAANQYDLDSVTLLDLGASYETEKLTASLNVSNLTDEVYLANCGSFGCYYGEGRTISAKVSTRW